MANTSVTTGEGPSSKMVFHVEGGTTLEMSSVIFTLAAEGEKPVNIYHRMKAVLVMYLEMVSYMGRDVWLDHAPQTRPSISCYQSQRPKSQKSPSNFR
jgi:hypothetical protein